MNLYSTRKETYAYLSCELIVNHISPLGEFSKKHYTNIYFVVVFIKSNMFGQSFLDSIFISFLRNIYLNLI